MHPLKKIYKEKIFPELKEELNCKNPHQVPKLVKINLNRGLGLNAQNTNLMTKNINEFRIITGQQPIITKVKKSIAGFKIRQGMTIGLTVTLREKKMYAFLERLINLVLPRIRDFRGLSLDGFDKNGNYNFGLQDQLVFPEINYDDVDQSRGLNLTIVTTANNREEAELLLKKFGFPLKDKN